VRGIRVGERVLLAGQTGMGKTTLELYLAGRLQPIRTIVVDPKGELTLGVTPVMSVSELPEALRGPACHWVPADLDRDTLEEGFELIKATPGPLLVLVDEAALVSSANWCPRGLKWLVVAGRQPRKMVIACTQRLSECHPVFRSQSEHIIVLVPAPIELDLKAIAGHIGREAEQLRTELDSLEAQHGKYSHLWYLREGNELRRCAPVPAPGDSGPPAVADDDDDRSSPQASDPPAGREEQEA
jgi:energy-coupling factor transporter ATP-binding protein EcfA2